MASRRWAGAPRTVPRALLEAVGLFAVMMVIGGLLGDWGDGLVFASIFCGGRLLIQLVLIWNDRPDPPR